ncbi:hypothetical protein SNE40_010240 [Patella caerulea]|uniref:Protein quiver n=1 Tax=Patella caerulea TaxID=87958 RepID=A0AAN8JUU5_PATCE
MNVTLTRLFGLLLMVSTVQAATEDRFMCITCNYQSNMEVTDCIDAPENMTEPQNRLRCPSKCMTQGRFSKGTLEPSFLLRGCMTLGDTREDGCEEFELEYHCYTFCSGHFCNFDSGFALDTATNRQPFFMLIYMSSVLVLFMK